MPKVAVVTGANKGIGLATVRGLCKQFDGDIFLTARNEKLGQQAVQDLNKEGLYPKFHQLDITNTASVNQLFKYLKDNYKGLDILINNAGFSSVYMYGMGKYPEDVDITMDINYHGTLKMCDVFFPILNPGARVVNVSTRGATHTLSRCSESRIKQFASLCTLDGVTQMMNDFVELSKNGKYESKGWPDHAVYNSYGDSKMGVIVINLLQQAAFDKVPNADILVNSCCPGFVDTDMTGHEGKESPDQGADTPLYLALLPPGVKEPREEFVYKRKAYDWKNREYPSLSDVTGTLTL